MASAQCRSLMGIIDHRARADLFRLPVFNPIALELQRLVGSDSDTATIERLIHRDTALATEILRVANSPFFAGLAPTGSIRDALVRLGFEQVTSIAMMAAQQQAFRARDPFLNGVMKRLWLHSMVSAIACRWLAAKTGHGAQRETAFLCGLLHDLGNLVILRILEDVQRSMGGSPLTEALLVELIRALHANYGMEVMTRWGLPAIHAEVARDHHLPFAPGQSPMTMIVRIVDATCARLAIGLEEADPIAPESLEDVQQLGLGEAQLAELELLMEDTARATGGPSGHDRAA